MTPYKTPYISSDEKLFVQIQNSGRSLNILYSKKIWQSFPYVKLGLKTWRGSFHAVLQPKILNSFFLTQFPKKKKRQNRFSLEDQISIQHCEPDHTTVVHINFQIEELKTKVLKF